MSAFSDLAEERTLDWVFSLASPAVPSAWWFRLHTGAPGDTGAANQSAGIAESSYTGGWGRSGSTVSNSGAWESNANGGASETITHVSLWDGDPDLTGNCWYQGALTASVEVANGAKFRFATGQFQVTHS